jgi:hypothetical protein
MNRAERRKMMKTIPGYKKALKSVTEKAVDDLEMMFRRNWKEDDETLNNGERSYDDDDDGEDDIYND